MEMDSDWKEVDMDHKKDADLESGTETSKSTASLLKKASIVQQKENNNKSMMSSKKNDENTKKKQKKSRLKRAESSEAFAVVKRRSIIDYLAFVLHAINLLLFILILFGSAEVKQIYGNVDDESPSPSSPSSPPPPPPPPVPVYLENQTEEALQPICWTPKCAVMMGIIKNGQQKNIDPCEDFKASVCGKEAFLDEYFPQNIFFNIVEDYAEQLTLDDKFASTFQKNFKKCTVFYEKSNETDTGLSRFRDLFQNFDRLLKFQLHKLDTVKSRDFLLKFSKLSHNIGPIEFRPFLSKKRSTVNILMQFRHLDFTENDIEFYEKQLQHIYGEKFTKKADFVSKIMKTKRLINALVEQEKGVPIDEQQLEPLSNLDEQSTHRSLEDVVLDVFEEFSIANRQFFVRNSTNMGKILDSAEIPTFFFIVYLHDILKHHPRMQKDEPNICPSLMFEHFTANSLNLLEKTHDKTENEKIATFFDDIKTKLMRRLEQSGIFSAATISTIKDMIWSMRIQTGLPDYLMDQQWKTTFASNQEEATSSSKFDYYNLVVIEQQSERHRFWELIKQNQMPIRLNVLNAQEPIYDVDEHLLFLPPRAFNFPIFHTDFPLRWNLGALGMTLAHHIMIGLDTRLRYRQQVSDYSNQVFSVVFCYKHNFVEAKDMDFVDIHNRYLAVQVAFDALAVPPQNDSQSIDDDYRFFYYQNSQKIIDYFYHAFAFSRCSNFANHFKHRNLEYPESAQIDINQLLFNSKAFREKFKCKIQKIEKKNCFFF